jgi:NitT/TauT family transport system ATP-binding protein
MRQRVAFLRTLMAERPVLLLDEPFASLDAITRAETQAWLAGVLAADNHTVMLVTHDVEEALYLSDRVVVLSARPGRVAVTLEVPEPRVADRAAAVSSPEFAELRRTALRVLAGEPA